MDNSFGIPEDRLDHAPKRSPDLDFVFKMTYQP